MVTENPEETVGGHAPVKAELSGRRSNSPPQELRKRNSTAPLLESTETRAQGSEFTGEISMHEVLHVNQHGIMPEHSVVDNIALCKQPCFCKIIASCLQMQYPCGNEEVLYVVLLNLSLFPNC